MEDNNLEVLFNQEISDDSSNHYIDLDDNSIWTYFDDLIFTNSISKNENLIFICPECSYCPRMIFVIIDNKISIKAYCYSHKKNEKNYNLKEFIVKFGKSYDEIIHQENYLNKPIELENKYKNLSNIVFDQEDNIIKEYCCQHQNSCKKYCELGDFLFCDSCNLNKMMTDKNLKIYYNDDRIENIDDL